MANFDAPELDDELLSAYLDDELSAEERTRVEERLAVDPQARQLLAELRGVSQAVQSLPAEKLGVDLSDAVLRRAERAILATNEQTAANERTPAGGASERAWTMPFGRSKRSWFWAGAALAAGLLLMFYDRGVNERGDMPNRVALGERDKDHETERERVRKPMGRLELRAAESVVAEGRADAKEETIDRFAEAPAAPAMSTRGPAEANKPASGAMALERGREVAALDATQELGFAVGSEAIAEATAGDVVVVHVNTTPEAMRNRVFDAVLVSNSIEPERPARDAASDNAPPGDVDVVLVEAAPLQIAGCMDALQKDEKNYLAIEVDEQSVANQKVKKLDDRADQFAGYNRGIVPAEQKVASNRFYYSQLDAGAGQGAQAQSDKVAVSSPQPPVEQQARQLEALGKYDTFAGRTAESEAVDGSSVDQRSSGGAAGEAPVTDFAGGVGGAQPSAGVLRSQSTASDYYYGANVQNNARRAVQKLATKADMLQVLFVLTCPSETPTSPAAAAVDSASSQPAATASEPAASPQPATSPATDDSVR
jgi:hypothetical protein